MNTETITTERLLSQVNNEDASKIVNLLKYHYTLQMKIFSLKDVSANQEEGYTCRNGKNGIKTGHRRGVRNRDLNGNGGNWRGRGEGAGERLYD